MIGPVGSALPLGREDLIPGELSVAIAEGGIRTATGMLPALLYTTEGLAKHGQRELFFAVARTGAPAPGYPLTMARTVHGFAAERRLVDAGDVSVFGRPGVDADDRVTGFVYAEPLALQSTLDGGTLVALPLVDGETAVVQRFGHARVLALLGAQERYYPHPYWFRPGRAPVVDDAEYRAATLLSQAPAYNLPFLRVVHDGSRLELSVPRAELPALGEAMREAPDVCAYLPGLAGTPKTYVWSPGQQGPAAIVAPGGESASRFGCNFLLVVRGGVEPTARQVEDGFAALLTGAMHARLLQAVEAGRPVEIGLPDGAVSALCLTISDDAVASQPALPRTEPLPRIVLLTSEEQLRRATTPAELSDFVERARVVVDRLFTGVRHGTEEVMVEFRLAPSRPVAVRIMARPEAPPRELQVVLERQLQGLAPPTIRYTEVAFQLHLPLARR
ncbi:hypothetical protein ACFFX1_43875 [Dactylosporangium sucinum]|uniref:Uncharacterized protein n=1 Tax=Dactylosporangium sucinum TaxID=1424081 RepID=A0A917X528_9ACTN|nr:hypothetical protein [Dactylosporangium sucinum]GGM67055.1 hypothetical protein GCM10007977_080910 [Dactylosporangium sucinum]